jgi:hypothetical protein
MKGSDLLVAALENEGVEQIFGVPGEENLDVVESQFIILASFCQTYNLYVYHIFIQSRHQGLEAQIFAVTGRAVHYWSMPGKCLASRRQDSCEFLRPFGRRGQERGYGRHRYVRRPWSQEAAYDRKFHPRVGARFNASDKEPMARIASFGWRRFRLRPPGPVPPWYPAPLQPCSSLQSR